MIIDNCHLPGKLEEARGLKDGKDASFRTQPVFFEENEVQTDAMAFKRELALEGELAFSSYQRLATASRENFEKGGVSLNKRHVPMRRVMMHGRRKSKRAKTHTTVARLLTGHILTQLAYFKVQPSRSVFPRQPKEAVRLTS